MLQSSVPNLIMNTSFLGIVFLIVFWHKKEKSKIKLLTFSHLSSLPPHLLWRYFAGTWEEFLIASLSFVTEMACYMNWKQLQHWRLKILVFASFKREPGDLKSVSLWTFSEEFNIFFHKSHRLRALQKSLKESTKSYFIIHNFCDTPYPYE